MQCFQGKSVYKGIAMGPIVVLKKNDYQVKRIRIEDTEAEVKRVDEALKASQEQLQKLYDKAVREVGEASAAIFEVHQMMLEDEDYLEAIQNMIRTEQVNAEYAVAVTGDNFAEMFASMDDDYMKARSADIKDISERLVRNLSGQGDVDLSEIEPSVIVADDLSPSETVQFSSSLPPASSATKFIPFGWKGRKILGCHIISTGAVGFSVSMMATSVMCPLPVAAKLP